MAKNEKIDYRKKLIQLGIGLGSGILVIILSLLPIYTDMESRLYDQRFTLRGDTYMDPNIATINIDAKTLEVEGRYQDWTRDKYYHIIKQINEMGARMIGFDVYFPEPSVRLIKMEDFEALLNLTEGNAENEENKTIKASEVFQLSPDYDQYMADIIKETGIVILGQSFIPADNQSNTYIENNTIVSSKHKEALEILKNFSIDFPQWRESSLGRYEAIEPPILPFLKFAKGVGYAQTEADDDGSVRRYPLVLVYNGRLYPSLALMMICEYLHADVKAIKVDEGKSVTIKHAVFPDSTTKDIVIPIDDVGRMLVNWAGDWRSSNFKHVPHVAITAFSRLIKKENMLEKMKKIAHENEGITDDQQRFLGKLSEAGFEFNDMFIESYLGFMIAEYSYSLIRENKEITKEGFLETFPMADESQFPQAQSIYKEINYNYKILDVLQSEPELNLESVAAKLGVKKYDEILRSYALIKHVLETGGPEATDHPLYFFAPNIDQSVYYPEDIKEKIFFYGLTAAGTWDLNPMPYNDRYPMLGLHANAFNTILTGQFLRKLSNFQNWSIILILGLVIGAVVPLFKPIKSALVITAMLIAYLIAAQWVFQSAGLWIDVLGPIMVLILGYMAITVYNFFSEEKEKKMIRGIFSRYVTKSVVDELIKNPDMVKLGGEKRELTVFFSDVAGFTTISESLTPEELVALLNEYLTAMTTIVLEYDGMIDKYEGDAIMAVFGAPVPYEDHAVRACKVSLDMQKKLAEMREMWKNEGKPELKVRIGLNTGPMVVGNMGAMDRLDYTVMGDSVNLGSRLEGANKQYGTYMMISEFTKAYVDKEIETRFLDSLRVKGKNLPVKVYEILETKENGLSENKQKVIELYNEGVEFYLQKEWDKGIERFENALQYDKEDGPSKVYLQRCRDYKENPPPENWDGVYVMTTK